MVFSLKILSNRKHIPTYGLDNLIREEDVVGLTEKGELEALFFDLPDTFVFRVTDRLNKEGIEIKWMGK